VKTSDFKPLEDFTSVANFGGLTVENGLDSLLVTGTLELNRDEVSIERARQLADLFARIANKLDADVRDGLVTAPDDEGSITEISNPF
jgi:hypothetical protein